MASEWSEVTIDAVAVIRNGAGVQQKYFAEKGVPLARVSDFTQDSIDLHDCKFVQYGHAQKWKSHFIRRNDVLIATVGSWPPNWSSVVGKVVRAPRDSEGAIQNQNTCCILPDSNVLDNGFLYYRLKQKDFAWHAANSAGGSANQARLPVKKLGTFRFNLPPLSGQKAIAHILGSLDDKIELNRRMNETLEGMAQALFKSWFVDFDPVIDKALSAENPIPEPLLKRAATRRALGHKRNPLPANIENFFPDSFVFTEELGWIPEGWEVVPFGGLIESTIGGDWGTEEQDDKHGLCVAIIRGTDIPSAKAGIRGKTPFRWVEQKKFDTRELSDGDVVLEVSGGSPKQPTGRSAYVTGDYLDLLGGPVVPASFCRKLRPKSSILGLYASLHLDRIYSAGKMWGYQNQSTGISNFQTKNFLENEALVLPDQDSILEFFFHTVRPIVDKMMTHEKEHLATLRDTLLPKLLSGEMRIPDAEKLIQEAL